MSEHQQNNTYPTGISVLDETLPGGIPNGAVVLLTTDPMSQGEKFLHHLVDGHSCGYITTSGSVEETRSKLLKNGISENDVDVVSVDYNTLTTDIKNAIAGVEDNDMIVIDTVNPLETPSITTPEAYRDLLTELHKNLRRTGGCIILRRMVSSETTTQDELYVADSMADYILNIKQRLNGDTVEELLHVPKARATADGERFKQQYKLEIGDTIRIDTSRDIA